MKFKLYHYWRSTCSWRVRWALEHKGIACHLIAVNLLTQENLKPEFKSINPMGSVPVLEVLDGIRTLRLTESLAIIEWLEERFPGRPLLPQSADDRQRVRALALTIIAGTQPLQNISVIRAVSPNEAVQAEWTRKWIRRGLGAYEALCRDVAGTFSFRSTLSVADLALAPQCHHARRFGIDLTEFPTIYRIDRYLQTLPEYEKSAPERFQPA